MLICRYSGHKVNSCIEITEEMIYNFFFLFTSNNSNKIRERRWEKNQKTITNTTSKVKKWSVVCKVFVEGLILGNPSISKIKYDLPNSTYTSFLQLKVYDNTEHLNHSNVNTSYFSHNKTHWLNVSFFVFECWQQAKQQVWWNKLDKNRACSKTWRKITNNFIWRQNFVLDW